MPDVHEIGDFLQNQRIARMLALRKAARSKPRGPAEVCPSCGFRIRGKLHAEGHHHLTLNRQEIIHDRWRATVKAQAAANARRRENS